MCIIMYLVILYLVIEQAVLRITFIKSFHQSLFFKKENSLDIIFDRSTFFLVDRSESVRSTKVEDHQN